MKSPLKMLALCSVILLDGCRTPAPERFQADVRINNHPARFAYDTGAGATVVFANSAKRLGLKVIAPPSSAQAEPGKVLTGRAELCHFSLDGETYSLRLQTVALPWPVSRIFDVDGAIGWPDMADDFIAIDATSDTIRGVDKLPTDTNGWFKLPLYKPPGILAVRTPRTDGKTGVWEIDTGNDGGVSLSPERWKQWRDTHPRGHGRLSFDFMPGSGVGVGRTVTADVLSVGPLAWTNVTVRKATATELGIVSSGDVFEGSVGIKALRQLDIIIDRKNGAAYFHPKPDSVLNKKSSRRDAQNGSGAQSHLLLDFGERQFLDIATDAFDSGHFESALTNVNKFLAARPNDETALEFRATTRYITHDWTGAMRDFRRVSELNAEVGTYARFFVWVIRSRMGQQSDATRELAEYIGPAGPPKSDPWEVRVGAFLLDRTTERDFLRAARSDAGDKVEHACEAWFYAGIKRQLAGDTAVARSYFQKCVATERSDEEEYNFAAAELKAQK